ncbi:hypothetical protein BpHYR1_032562 [Brachionus plicatilis]|uniref:MULE transposase domain-containing protein n=1 Tax=Brachionus plicatilis TaxID=10195 RepID=A0A3M7RQT7_BRAPC|nr:hypothetical protein BpHYR1_032562 [Brachionus plicatilis]
MEENQQIRDYNGLQQDQNEFHQIVVDHEHTAVPKNRGIQGNVKEMISNLYDSANLQFSQWLKKGTLWFGCSLSIDDGNVLDFYVSITVEHFCCYLFDKYFCVAFTTNRLIELCRKRDLMVVDATYKVIFQGHPFIIAGIVDYHRQYHLVAVAVCSRENEHDYEFLYRAILDEAEL